MQCGVRLNNGTTASLQYTGKHLTETENLTLPWSDHYVLANARFREIGAEATASLGGLRKDARDVSIFWNPKGAVGTSFLDFEYEIRLGVSHGTTEAPGYEVVPLKRTAAIFDVKLGANFWK